MNGPRVAQWVRRESSVRVGSALLVPVIPSLEEVATSCLARGGLLKPLFRAVKALRWVLRNSFAGSAAAWIFAEVLSSGVWIVTGRGPEKQEYEEFRAGGAFWYASIFSLFVQGLAVKQLLSETFVDQKEYLSSPRKAVRILWLMMVRGAWVHVAIGISCSVVLYLFISRSRFVIYISSLWMMHILSAINAISYDLFKTETKRGRRSTVAVITGQRPSVIQTPDANASVSVERPYRQSIFRSLLRAWRKFLPLHFTSLIAVGYVHATSTIILDESKTVLDASGPSPTIVLFVLGSVLLKFSLQEATKRMLLMRRALPKREEVMIFISTPTLLVDIQLRVVLLQLSNMVTTSAAKGSIGLGLIEIAVRFVKMILARWEAQGGAHRRKRVSSVPQKSTAHALVSAKPYTSAKIVSPTSSISAASIVWLRDRKISSNRSSSVTRTLSSHTSRVLVIHACETYADMYAEYLALGCSYAVLVVFSQNPHFNLYYSSGSTSNTSYWTLFGLQIAIEIAVDVVSSAIEVSLGLEVESIAQHTWSAAGNMMLLTFVNVGLCAGLYSRTPKF